MSPVTYEVSLWWILRESEDLWVISWTMPEPITDGLTWYRVYRSLLRKLHVVMGLNVNQSEMHGIYGIECGPFRNAEYEWTQGEQ